MDICKHLLHRKHVHFMTFSFFIMTLRDVYKIRFKNYMFVNKLFIEVLKFDDFSFGEFSKIAKIGQNYMPAKTHLYGILNN